VIARTCRASATLRCRREDLDLRLRSNRRRAPAHRCGIERGVIVGNSRAASLRRGGIQFSTRVEKLVLVSAAALSTERQTNEPVLPRARAPGQLPESTPRLGATRSDTLTRRPRMRRQIMSWSPTGPTTAGAADRRADQGLGQARLRPGARCANEHPIRDRLARSAVRARRLGEKDRLVPVRDAYEFGRLIPQARVVVWARHRHVAMLERPAAFNALVDEFIAE